MLASQTDRMTRGSFVDQIQVFVLVLQKDLCVAFLLALFELLFTPLAAGIAGIARNLDSLDMAVPSGIGLRIDHDGAPAIRTRSDRFGLCFADVIGIVEDTAVATVERLVRIRLAFERFLVLPVA